MTGIVLKTGFYGTRLGLLAVMALVLNGCATQRSAGGDTSVLENIQGVLTESIATNDGQA